MEERLQKYISASGYCSRREAEKMIEEGLIEVNGEVVRSFGVKVSEFDKVTIMGQEIKPQENLIYFVLNKPVGFSSMMKDSRGRKCIGDLIKNEGKLLVVGSLEYTTSGLIMLTNDPEFKKLLEKDGTNVRHEYHLKIDGLLRKEESKKIEKGINLGEYTTKRARILNVQYDDDKTSTYLDIVINETKSGEIRRIFDSIGHRVKSLKRVRVGDLELDVDGGYYRSLKPHEVKRLKLLALGKIKK